jgi:hypothetical protein
MDTGVLDFFKKLILDYYFCLKSGPEKGEGGGEFYS